ncbi:MAG TPA: helix-hairpin-helix domain-containing protein [Pyrinomonadaceae bacterium]|nr:helix-hairpin-helix domain-containing protein [Pyrinomonadaceae bacterium]
MREKGRKEERKLIDLVSIGPAMLEDFELLGITSVSQLRRRSPQRMYRELCRLRGQRIDPCCLDVFVTAVAQAKDPDLPIEQRQWWYWSKLRKASQNTRGRSRKSARRVAA